MKEGAFRIPTIRVQLQLRLIAAQQGLVLGSSSGHVCSTDLLLTNSNMNRQFRHFRLGFNQPTLHQNGKSSTLGPKSSSQTLPPEKSPSIGHGFVQETRYA